MKINCSMCGAKRRLIADFWFCPTCDTGMKTKTDRPDTRKRRRGWRQDG